MKKFLFVFGFIVIAFMPFKVKASYLPPVAPDTSMVPSFLQSVAQSQIATDTGYYSSYKPDYDTLNQIVNGRTIANSMTEVYVDNATIDTFDDFVNGNGEYVPASNTYTAFGSSDIGRYSYVADKTTGEILSYDWDNNGLVSTLQSGDERAMPYPIWLIDQLDHLAAPTLQNYQDTLSLIEDAQMHQRYDIYDESQLSQSAKEFIDNNDFYLYMHSNSMGWDMFVPNGCSVNCVISGNGASFNGVVSPNQTLPNGGMAYVTAPNQVKFVNGNSSNRGFMKQSSVSYFGRTWPYVPAWMNSYNVLGEGGYLSYKSPTQAQFNQAISLNGKYITMQPVDVTNENNYYNYTYVTENPPQYHTIVNNNYAPSQPISPNNYPVNNTLTLNYPDTNTNNYINNIYNYYTTPQQGESIGSIADPILPENIPILSNLEYRFPFSIPFDMYKMLKGLSVPRETPVIDVSFVIPRANIEWNIYYDMAPFEDTAHLFRILFLISYIIGLAYFSYDHFFGR